MAMPGRYIIAVLLVCACGGWAAPLLGAELPAAPQGLTTVADVALLQQGLALYRAGRLEEAMTQLRGFAASRPDSPRLAEVWLTLARIALQQQQPEDAALYARLIPLGQRSAAAQWLEGAAEIAQGHAASGMALLQGVDPLQLNAADRLQYYRQVARGHLQQERPLAALTLLQQALPLASSPASRLELLAQAHDLLREGLDDAALAEAEFMLRGTPIGLDAQMQQAQRLLTAGDATTARQLVEEVLASSVDFPYRGEAALLRDRLAGKSWLRRSIGVVLPLSGRYGTFGQLVRRGMELSAELHNAQQPPVELIFRDAGADPEQSAAAVTQLATEERVMAVAGPLTGSAAVAAATRAQQERVPLLTLSQREGLAQTGNYVFRNSLTSRLQVEELVRYSMEQQGLTRFAVLAPDNKQGKELADLFTQEVLGRGGVIVAREAYAVSANDFGRQIKLLLGKDPDAPEPEAAAVAAETEAELPPGAEGATAMEPEPPPFDALFLPDYADRIGLIAPQLPFYGIEGVQLLGINGWNSPDLLPLAGRYLEGAVFVDGFFRYSPYPFVQEFANDYFERYHEEPTILEAQGFDVAGILLSLLDRPEVTGREELRFALSQLKGYPGVTGATSFNPDGDAAKLLYLLQVQNGNIVQLN